MSPASQSLTNNQLPLGLDGYWEVLQTDPGLTPHAIAYAWAASRFTPGPVLDIGCEYGFGSALLAKANSDLHVMGCDVDPQSLRFANVIGKDSGAVVCQAAASSLPFSSNAFSGVCLFNILHLVADPSLVVREARRVLKPRQSLVITLPQGDNLSMSWRTGRLDERLTALVGPLFEDIWFPGAVAAPSAFPGMKQQRIGAGTPILVALCC